MKNVEVKEYDEDEESEIEESGKNEEQVEREGGRQKSVSVTKIIKRGHTDQPKKRSRKKGAPRPRPTRENVPGRTCTRWPAEDMIPPGRRQPNAVSARDVGVPDQQKFAHPPRRGDARARLAGKENEPAAEVPGGRPKIQSQAPQVYIPIHFYVGT